MTKLLQRDKQNAKIAGVCAGLAEYLEIDVTLVRVLFVLLTIFTAGSGIIAYIVMWLIMPVKGSTPTPPPVVSSPPEP